MSGVLPGRTVDIAAARRFKIADKVLAGVGAARDRHRPRGGAPRGLGGRLVKIQWSITVIKRHLCGRD